MIPLRLSTITLIRSSIRKALSRRITTFSSAMEKHVIIATDTMLKNEKMNIIFHRMEAHASLNCSKIFTSYRPALEPSTQYKCGCYSTALGRTASRA
jgi:hypothetical protein